MKKWKSNKKVKLLPALALTFGVLAPMPASASIVEECFDNQCTITFGYTGQIEPLTFPANATNIRFEALGAQGGKSGGGGGRVTGELTQVPEILYITVGGAGGSNAAAVGGFNGGGTSGGSAGVEGSGGGASDIRIGYSLSSRIVVAGGGGGRGSGLGSGGGAGGGLVGANGKTGQGSGGLGGSQSAGGLGGATYGDGTSGTAGDWGVGGTGGYGPLHGGGGGGGGYYGGGGGGADADSCCTDAGGGGGGSSYTDPSFITNVIHTQGVRPGAGQITFTYQLSVESNSASPTEEITPPPAEEPATPPATQEPPITETTVSNLPEPESVNSAPSEPEQQVTAQPETTQAPAQEPAPSDSDVASELAEELIASIAAEVIPNEPRANTIEESGSAIAELRTLLDPLEQDEILKQPSNLSQSAQKVVVPVQNKQTPWSSNSLFAGLIGLGVFALITGLVVARRGVPGAIAS
jgi:hypothetical protein